MNELHKSRFEGDNFRNRYMSKYQPPSVGEEKIRNIYNACQNLLNSDPDNDLEEYENVIKALKS